MTSLSIPYTSIFHPTDFSKESHVAFVHAVKLALLTGAELTIMHIEPEKADPNFEDFPRIRKLLTQWGHLKEDSPKESLSQAGILVKKILAVGDNPAKAIVDYLHVHTTDLIVMATHQKKGPERWFQQTVAEPVARGTHTKMLMLPSNGKGFISPDSGQPDLKTVLVPIHRTPNPQPSIDAVTGLASLLDCHQVTFQLMHVGDIRDMPPIQKVERKGWEWQRTNCKGDVVDWIYNMGEEFQADMIAMSTAGPTGLLDVLFGSTTEQVVRNSNCPVFAIHSH